MNKINYNVEIKQTENNKVFDIVFDKVRLNEDWKLSFQDFVECSLYSNKRLNPSIAKNQPQPFRGGSPCDFVFNITGESFGSYIDFASKERGSFAEKNDAIITAFTQKLSNMKEKNLIEMFDISTLFIDSLNDTISYKLQIKSGKNQVNKEFKIYANN